MLQNTQQGGTCPTDASNSSARVAASAVGETATTAGLLQHALLPSAKEAANNVKIRERLPLAVIVVDDDESMLRATTRLSKTIVEHVCPIPALNLTAEQIALKILDLLGTETFKNRKSAVVLDYDLFPPDPSYQGPKTTGTEVYHALQRLGDAHSEIKGLKFIVHSGGNENAEKVKEWATFHSKTTAETQDWIDSYRKFTEKL